MQPHFLTHLDLLLEAFTRPCLGWLVLYHLEPKSIFSDAFSVFGLGLQLQQKTQYLWKCKTTFFDSDAGSSAHFISLKIMKSAAPFLNTFRLITRSLYPALLGLTWMVLGRAQKHFSDAFSMFSLGLHLQQKTQYLWKCKTTFFDSDAGSSAHFISLKIMKSAAPFLNTFRLITRSLYPALLGLTWMVLGRAQKHFFRFKFKRSVLAEGEFKWHTIYFEFDL